MGTEALDLFNTFEFRANEVLIDKFDNYFKPKVNITLERHIAATN